MRVFKFGGASVKDAESIRNMENVLKGEGTQELLLVVSAMGKMTNAFETLIPKIIQGTFKAADINPIKEYHSHIVLNLFDEHHPIFSKLERLFEQLIEQISSVVSKEYDFVYDQVVCYGELLSTTIVSEYLQEVGITNTWLDVRTCIHTNAEHRNAKVDWQKTQEAIQKAVDRTSLTITQGFLGAASEQITTTLGREGSDYTAGIFAFCLDAASVTIWKDVPGVLNADPRVFENPILLHQISYEEAIEMAFYGASVIHPKTIKPLENKEIPLWVKSFKEPKNSGTCVKKGTAIVPSTPCYIVKKHQILLSISTLDFSFMVESNLSHIFKQLAAYQLKVNLIQNSAISFSVCVEDTFLRVQSFLKEMEAHYKIRCVEDVSLYTIRHFDAVSKEIVGQRGTAILTQINKETMQVVVHENAS